MTKNKPIYAPHDIREIKAARVAFLEAKVAELQGQGYEARISGTGTLQMVRYALPKVRHTKMQYRGLCQCCGRLIAVVGGTLVHHGYERPFGRGFSQTQSCGGTYQQPLSESCDATRRNIAGLEKALETAKTGDEMYHLRCAIGYLKEIVANYEAGKYIGTTKEYQVQV